MFKKDFVSVVFSSKKIQILNLDSEGKKVKKLGMFDLEPGLIVNHQVKNSDLLAKLIADAWKKLGLHEKSVGLVVPEFSTYMKSLKIPKLDLEDLDEAVQWQSRDFLPDGNQEMVMDWQVIEKKTDGYQVLAVAIPQSVLAGYIDAAVKAGLLPLVVETPSLSLVRLVGDNKPSLLVYVSSDETIIILAQGETVLASAVASSNSQNEIFKTAERLILHYSSIKTERVILGGAGLSQQFINSMAEYLKLPVQLFKWQVSGMDENLVQQYLVAISLQLKDPSGPRDTATINLLPPQWEKYYRDILRNWRFWTLTLVASVAVWSCFLSVLVAYMIFGAETQSVSNTKTPSQSEESSGLFDQITKINNLSSEVVSVGDSLISPVKLINLIVDLRPAGVSITQYSVNLEKGTATIHGRASDRNTLIAFRDALTARQEFSEVDLPISSLLLGSDLEYQINITLQNSAKKKSIPKLSI